MSSPFQTYIKLTFLQRSYIRVTCVACVCVAIYVRVTCVACVCVAICICCEMCACVTAAVAPTAVYTVTHTHIRTHFLIMALAFPGQMLLFTLQRTTYERPFGDIRVRRPNRPPRHGRPRPGRRRLTAAVCSPRTKPASSSLYGAVRAHDVFRLCRQHPQP